MNADESSKALNNRELRALRFVERCVMRTGRSPSVREVMQALGYASPRSAAVLLDDLIAKGYLARRANRALQILKSVESPADRADTIPVPLVGDIACGKPLLASENIEAFVPVSTRLVRLPQTYFLLRARGDSMNLAGISDGDLVLVRRQASANNGESVVALIDDEATIKEFQKQDNIVLLHPRSTNAAHPPIILTTDFQLQGVVQTTIPQARSTAIKER